MDEPRRILTGKEREKMVSDHRVLPSARAHIREAILEFQDLYAGLSAEDRKNIFDPKRKSGQSATSMDEMEKGARAIIRFVHRGLSEVKSIDEADSIFDEETGMSHRNDQAHIALRRARQLVSGTSSAITRQQVPSRLDEKALETASVHKEATLGHPFGRSLEWTSDPSLWSDSYTSISTDEEELSERILNGESSNVQLFD